MLSVEVISKVPATLHTPLMSGSNSVPGIVVIGAKLIAAELHTWLGHILAFAAMAFGAMNVVCGYVVTDRTPHRGGDPGHGAGGERVAAAGRARVVHQVRPRPRPGTRAVEGQLPEPPGDRVVEQPVQRLLRDRRPAEPGDHGVPVEQPRGQAAQQDGVRHGSAEVAYGECGGRDRESMAREIREAQVAHGARRVDQH
ncbi:NAD(P) transhydrogenase subunit alpha [Streptomyces sp. HUAS TT20]|uniref:NAD(P) transhydrogenase subunit alpha n=1 Tax=Streptomyces sp. HUAS TT20 TaxID=3447509 RepID=UPI0021D7FA77|nr:NAD(P) transhydrogenase subunit alpha [Streptomyces sp. HUAS 15-9]UXY32286.1 NAD(P) transhydrogenase subunit alpha [Streptomyces sp. HUAS 15-9]